MRSLHSYGLGIVACAVLAGVSVRAAVQPDFPITPTEPDAVIEGALAQLGDFYVFPQVAADMDTAIRTRRAQSEYRSMDGGEELARKLTADLQAVSHDEHLRLEYVPKGAPTSNGTASDNTTSISEDDSGFENLY